MLTAATRRPVIAGGAGPTLGVRAVLALSLGLAATVHALVVAEHLDGWALAGTFFLALELVEGALAVAVVAAWSRAVGWAVVVVSLATLALWSVSRGTGLPLGPSGARLPEGVGAADLACSLLELTATVVALSCLLPRTRRPWPPPVWRVGVGTLVVLCLVVGYGGLRGALESAPHHESGSGLACDPSSHGGCP